MTNFCALNPQISQKNAEFPYLHLRNPRHLRKKRPSARTKKTLLCSNSKGFYDNSMLFCTITMMLTESLCFGAKAS